MIKNNYELFYSLDNVEDAFWKETRNQEYLNFFQTPKAVDFFKLVKPEIFTVGLKKDNKIIALISGVIEKEKGIKAYFSKRAIIYGGPFFAPEIKSEEVSKLLTALINKIKKKVIYIEIRNFNNYNDHKDAFYQLGFSYTPHLNFHLNTTSEEDIQKNMSKSKLRDIKKSIKLGAEIFEAENSIQITSYYKILLDLYLTRIKTPLPNEDFFQKLFKNKVAKFLLIRYNDEIIGGVIIAQLQNNTLYEWFVCGEDRKYKNIFPSTLSTWAAIEYAYNNGIKYLDFMGAGSPDKDYGVREFKSKFGGELVEHGRFLYVANKTLYAVGKKAFIMLKNKNNWFKKKAKPKVKQVQNTLVFNDVYDKIDVNAWQKLNDESKNGSVFQSPEMYKFWKAQKGSEPFVFCVNSTEGELQAVCMGVVHSNGIWPLSSLTKRAIIYGGPVAKHSSNQEKVIDFFLKKINKKLARNIIYIETRNLSSYDKFKKIYKDNKWGYIPYQNYILKLTSEEEVFKLFTSEKRRQIRRSIKEGVEISYENNEENIVSVYNIIHKIYVERVNKPLPTVNFFISLCKFNFANVVALKFENKIIGGAFLLQNEKNVYDWYRGGLDRDYKHQFPSTFAAWAVINYGIKNDKQFFDFMGAGIKGEDYGVRKFKSQFGGELVEHGRFIKILMPLAYKTGKSVMKLLKKK
ncbi:MAG: peptidoglycan bridge formation glycyltransferase FemA/FemB family protein [Flavobacteriaceae bacterium]|nr:peptidoglycan bridge formation glycyltransferase FemA/FemB family protein [Flavobacteriaceae bacterium]